MKWFAGKNTKLEIKETKYVGWPGSSAFATDDAAEWAFEVTAKINRLLKETVSTQQSTAESSTNRKDV